MPKKFSHFIFLITFVLTLIITLSLSILNVNSLHQESIDRLKEQGIVQLQNQISQIDDSLSIITNYSAALTKATQTCISYDKNSIERLFKNLFLKELGVFQLRLLSDKGMELIRYNLDTKGEVIKSHNLQDKSKRYYFKEAQSLQLGKQYISKLDLNEENGKIEIPHKKTIRVVQKVIISNKLYYLVVNYNLSTTLKTALDTAQYNLFFVEKDGQINMHLDARYAFSKQQNKNLFWHDILDTKEEFISQQRLKSLPYDVLISLKKSEIDALNTIKITLLKKMAIIALLISFIISSLLYYFLSKYLNKLSTNVLYTMRNRNIRIPMHFQEFEEILDKVKRQQHIIQHNLQALQAQKEFTHSILDSQSNIVLITDGITLKNANKAMLDFFNFNSLKEFNEAHDCICDFFIPEKGYLIKEKKGKTWLNVVLEDITKTQKVMMVDSQGEKRIFQIFTERLKDNDNNFVLSLSDITQLHTFQVSLEEKVQQQISQIREKEQQLLHQSRLAQMGEMISMIAHQWRQPLSVISSTAANLSFKLMMDDIDKKEFIKEIAHIDDYSQKLSKTIDDFRGFFKEDNTKEKTTLEEMVTSTTAIIKDSVENKNITIKNIFTCHKEIETYANDVKQVLLNLLKNAEDILINRKIKNPSIMIETSCDEHTYTIMVKDNANGIPEDIKEKIFDPYFSTKEEKNGVGLGLYMSKNIIEEHCDGLLTATNDTDGAVFTITFKRGLS